MSRCISANVFGGRHTPSGVRSVIRCSGALRRVGLKFRIPNRAKQLFIRFTMRVRSEGPTASRCASSLLLYRSVSAFVHGRCCMC